MAAYISVPRDLTRVKSKVFLNLTKRQLVCFAFAASLGVPSFFLLKKTGNVSLATLGMMLIMLPLFFSECTRRTVSHWKRLPNILSRQKSSVPKCAPTGQTTIMLP